MMTLNKVINYLRTQLHELGYRTDQVALGSIYESSDGYYDVVLYDVDTDEEIVIEIAMTER